MQISNNYGTYKTEPEAPFTTAHLDEKQLVLTRDNTIYY